MQNKLICKRNGNGRVSSYTLNVSIQEAKQLGFLNNFYDTCFINKEIVDGKLVISRAFPQTGEDLAQILDSFGIIGKRLSNKMLLELLYFIEKDSEAYRNQKNKVFASIRYLGRGWIGYKGQYAYFTFKVKMNKNRIIEDYSDTYPSRIPDF